MRKEGYLSGYWSAWIKRLNCKKIENFAETSRNVVEIQKLFDRSFCFLTLFCPLNYEAANSDKPAEATEVARETKGKEQRLKEETAFEKKKRLAWFYCIILLRSYAKPTMKPTKIMPLNGVIVSIVLAELRGS